MGRKIGHPRLFWGPRCLEILKEELSRAGGHRPLIICNPSVHADPALMSTVNRLLGSAIAGTFPDVKSHSPVEAASQAASMLRATRADSIVAIGSGSAMVTARAANILHGEGAATPLEHMVTRVDADGAVVSPRLTASKLPMVAVPTTPTTAMGKAGSALAAGRGGRLTMFDPKARASSIFVDPQFALSSPASVFERAAMNAFVMAVEGMTANSSNVFSDAMLSHAARGLPELLDTMKADAQSADTRVEIMLHAFLAGEGTDISRSGLTAALSHAIAHSAGVHNSLTDGILLPKVLDFVAPEAVRQFRLLSRTLGGDREDIPRRVGDILRALGAPRRLRDIGVPRDDLPVLAAQAAVDFAAYGSPRRATAEDLVRILEESW